MNYWVRFWVIILSVMVSLSALGFLTLSFVFPGVDPFMVGRSGRLAVAVVGVAAMGVVVWTVTTFGGDVPDTPGRQNQ